MERVESIEYIQHVESIEYVEYIQNNPTYLYVGIYIYTYVSLSENNGQSLHNLNPRLITHSP